MGNDFMMEKAQKKHKNYLRRQRAKQAKLNAQKEKEQEQEEAENTKKEEQQTNNKFDTLSLSGSSDSGVSVKSGNSTKNSKKLNLPKVKTVHKYSVVRTPEVVTSF